MVKAAPGIWQDMIFLNFPIAAGARDEVCPVVDAHFEDKVRSHTARVNADTNVKRPTEVIQVPCNVKTIQSSQNFTYLVKNSSFFKGAIDK